jgi:photosystem II stability/assembly factor-like uncharacterized protein
MTGPPQSGSWFRVDLAKPLRVARFRHGRLFVIAFIALACLFAASSLTFDARSGASNGATSTHRGNPYSVGSAILALKLTRMQMLNARVGVGVAPIVTLGGGLVRAYLVRTNDAGESWTVVGVFPKGFYPWTTAFATPQEGYVIDSGGALFTNNAGRTWAKVATSYSPLSISIKADEVWIPVENYCPTTTAQNPCGTYLDSFKFGSLVPTSVTHVPSDQPQFFQVAPTVGYAIGSDKFAGSVYFTSNAGTTWRDIKTPCEHQRISGGSVASSSQLLVYCERGSPSNSDTATIYKSHNGGTNWQKVADVQAQGPDPVVGSSGQFLWEFSEDATLFESSDGGRLWVDVPRVKYGTNDVIATYGAHEAWHVLTGRGIYRTLNGRTWKILK